MEAELERLTDIVLGVKEEMGRKDQQLEHMEIMLEEGEAELEDMEKMLEESSTSLTSMTEERDHLKKAFKKKSRKLKKAMSENERLIRQSEDQRQQIEQQAMVIEKLEDELYLKSLSTGDKVQGEIDTNGFHIKLEEEDFELDTVLNLKQTHANEEHRSNHDLQETHKVSSEESENGEESDDVAVLEEFSMIIDMDFQHMLPPNPPPESSVDPSSLFLGNSSSYSGGMPMALGPDTLVAGGVLSKRQRSAESEQFAESNPPYTPNFEGDELKRKKMKGLPPSVPSCTADHENLLQQQQQKPIVGYGKCVQCETTKTSEWRDGPMGPGTLCNICEISLIVSGALG